MFILELATEKVLKKINFKLNEKGMDITDWINCITYDHEFQMDELLRIGDRLGLRLNRE